MRTPRQKPLTVRVEVQPHARDLPLPAIQSDGAAGLDLVAALPATAPVTLKPRARALIPTGLILEIPMGYEAQVRPRSGLAVKHGITVLNSPGTIDSDYRGEVQVLLINLGTEPFVVRRGERIAQMVIASHASVRLVPAATLTTTRRGAGGFGSTGRAPAKPARKPAPKRKSSAKRPARPKK